MHFDIDVLAAKKLLAVAGTGLIGLAALTACDSADDGAETDTGTNAESAESADADEAAAGADGTGPESPLPAGSTVEVGDWSLTLASAELDATDAIMEVNQFNEAPADGFQQALLTIDGAYNGTETGTLWLDIEVGVWADGVFYDSTSCTNVVENDLMDASDVSGGGTASGAVCVEIPSDAEAPVAYFEDFLSFDEERRFVEIG
jgi:hypothetical protein